MSGGPSLDGANLVGESKPRAVAHSFARSGLDRPLRGAERMDVFTKLLGQFRGEIRHAAQCDSAAANRDAFTGKRVLVVGAAFSGTEIACQIAPYVAMVTVSLRRPMWFIPRFVAARPGGHRYPYDLVFFNRSPENRLLRKPHLFLSEIGGDPAPFRPSWRSHRARIHRRTWSSPMTSCGT